MVGILRLHRMSEGWRRRPDLNRGWRFCRPLPYRLATAPRKRQMAGLATRPPEPGEKKMLRRETGFEPATSTLARSHSTTELFPPEPPKYHTAGVGIKGRLGRQRLCAVLQPHGPEHLGGLFGRGRVDVEPGAPLEAGDAGQLRHDLDVPVVQLGHLFGERRGVDDEVEGRRLE